jgi:hypothetical protein
MNPSVPYSGASAPQTVTDLYDSNHETYDSAADSLLSSGYELLAYPGSYGGDMSEQAAYNEVTSSYAINYLHGADGSDSSLTVDDESVSDAVSNNDPLVTHDTMFLSVSRAMSKKDPYENHVLENNEAFQNVTDARADSPVTPTTTPLPSVTPMKVTEFNPYAGRRPQPMLGHAADHTHEKKAVGPQASYGGWSAMVIPVPVPLRENLRTADGNILTHSELSKSPRSYVNNQ